MRLDVGRNLAVHMAATGAPPTIADVGETMTARRTTTSGRPSILQTIMGV